MPSSRVLPPLDKTHAQSGTSRCRRATAGVHTIGFESGRSQAGATQRERLGPSSTGVERRYAPAEATVVIGKIAFKFPIRGPRYLHLRNVLTWEDILASIHASPTTLEEVEKHT